MIKMKRVFLLMCLVVCLVHEGIVETKSIPDAIDEADLQRRLQALKDKKANSVDDKETTSPDNLQMKVLALKEKLEDAVADTKEKTPAQVKDVIALLKNELEKKEEQERKAEYKRYLDNLKEGDLHEGDILLDREMIELLKDDVSDVPNEKRQLTARNNRKWVKVGGNTPIPYVMATGGAASSAFRLAINTLSMLTCIKFEPRQTQRNYIQVTAEGNSCYSSYGRQGGMQKLNLGNGCHSKGTALHEILHAIGFFHEQSRPDRDRYVNIIYSDIKPGMSNQFSKKRSWEVTTLGLPYDFKSLMHYRNKEFSKNGLRTIEPIGDPSMALGNSDLSPIDVEKINLFYGCLQAQWQMDDFIIQIITSSSWFAGTDSKVYMEIFWEKGLNSGEFPVPGEFERSSKDSKEMYLPKENRIIKINVRHDNTGFGSHWKLDKVIIEDRTQSTKYECYFNEWLDNTLVKTISCRRIR